MTSSLAAPFEPHALANADHPAASPAVPQADALTPQVAEAVAVEAPESVASEGAATSTQTTAPKGRGRDRGRNPQPRRGASAEGQADQPAARPARTVHPLLEQLAALYPHLFGAEFLPLKRGIFQDLLAAHPDVFDREALKAALSQHTRSSRYLTAVAAGLQRHDLHGVAVEDMAPAHVYQSLVEVFRRRQSRANEDLTPKVRQRIVQAFEVSGLSRDAYSELVRGRDEAINTVLDEALAEAGMRAARDEAQLRAFEASGQTVAAFADMYGLDLRAAAQTLARAQTRRAVTLAAVELAATTSATLEVAAPDRHTVITLT